MVLELTGWGMLYWLYVLVLPFALIITLISYIAMSSGKSRNKRTWLAFTVSSLMLHAYLGRFLWTYKTQYFVVYLAVVLFIDIATYIGFVRNDSSR